MKQILGVVCLSLFLQGFFLTPTYAATTDDEMRSTLIALIQRLQVEINARTVTTATVSEKRRNDIELESGDQLLAVYDSVTAQLRALEGSARVQHQAYWDLVQSVIPAELTMRVKEVVFYSNPNSTTDAYVETLYAGSNNIWRLAVNYATYEDDPDYYTAAELLIHEFGHVISLNETQVYPVQDNIRCVTFETLEGCPRADSYYQKLINEFWPDQLLDAALDAEEAMDQETTVAEYYERYESYFVSEYAATNPGEDWSETFAFFVLYEKPEAGTVADRKIRSFYQYPKLVQYRNEILAALEFAR